MDHSRGPLKESTRAYYPAQPAGNRSHQGVAEVLRLKVCFRPRTLARLFNSETGDTPARFTERARADAARGKLEQTVLPLETIAEQCGFGNAERMRRTFQRLFDVSPQDYRARFRSTLLN
jgi:transcriptional regulator GlxA family with amidase domain